MAGDWIKMRTDLAEDPAVIGMSARLGIDEDTVVGKLHRLWAWADRQSRDGHAASVTTSWIDRYVHREGFADAMCAVGWLKVDETGVLFPNFDRHNGKTAKERALGSIRQASRRAAGVTNVTEAPLHPSRSHRDKSVTREEKRREELKASPLPPRGDRAKTITLRTYLANCAEAKVDAIPTTDPVFAYAERTGIPHDFLELAWEKFCGTYGDGDKKQSTNGGWPKKFRNAVAGNWGKVWYIDGEGRYLLTTVGLQTRRDLDARQRQAAAA